MEGECPESGRDSYYVIILLFLVFVCICLYFLISLFFNLTRRGRQVLGCLRRSEAAPCYSFIVYCFGCTCLYLSFSLGGVSRDPFRHCLVILELFVCFCFVFV